jgi:predicted DNA-binding transcriptional regulator YafY
MSASRNKGGAQAEGSARQARAQYSSHFPLSRLLQLVLLLQTERCPNARRLAEICEVSRRTIYRDLAILADSGITVVYRPDRQGYELNRDLFLQPLRLEDREAAALLVLCGRWEDGADMGLGDLADRAVNKLIQGLPEAARARLRNLTEVMSLAGDRRRVPEERRGVHEEILEAVTQRRQIRLWFTDAAGREPEATKLAIYRLVRVGGRWTLIGRSSRHCRVISIPLDQVARAELTGDETLIPPRFDLKRHTKEDSAAPNQELRCLGG